MCEYEHAHVLVQAAAARLSGASVEAVGEELMALDGGKPWNQGMKALASVSCDRQNVKSVSQRMRFWPAASPIAPNVSKAAMKLMSMHASTAAAERNWHMFSGLYRNALRANLKVRGWGGQCKSF